MPRLDQIPLLKGRTRRTRSVQFVVPHHVDVVSVSLSLSPSLALSVSLSLSLCKLSSLLLTYPLDRFLAARDPVNDASLVSKCKEA